MALTTTATIETFQVVSQELSLRKPVIVTASPNRGIIKIMVEPSKSLKEFAKAIAQGLKCNTGIFKSVVLLQLRMRSAKKY